jgi:hypothetical protein
MLSPAFLKDLRFQAERPFGSRPENPEVLKALLDEIERLNRELDRMRRSIE